jgi:hypothetical protein
MHGLGCLSASSPARDQEVGTFSNGTLPPYLYRRINALTPSHPNRIARHDARRDRAAGPGRCLALAYPPARPSRRLSPPGRQQPRRAPLLSVAIETQMPAHGHARRSGNHRRTYLSIVRGIIGGIENGPADLSATVSIVRRATHRSQRRVRNREGLLVSMADGSSAAALKKGAAGVVRRCNSINHWHYELRARSIAVGVTQGYRWEAQLWFDPSFPRPRPIRPLRAPIDDAASKSSHPTIVTDNAIATLISIGGLVSLDRPCDQRPSFVSMTFVRAGRRSPSSLPEIAKTLLETQRRLRSRVEPFRLSFPPPRPTTAVLGLP